MYERVEMRKACVYARWHEITRSAALQWITRDTVEITRLRRGACACMNTPETRMRVKRGTHAADDNPCNQSLRLHFTRYSLERDAQHALLFFVWPPFALIGGI